jgi:hypothetical protein
MSLPRSSIHTIGTFTCILGLYNIWLLHYWTFEFEASIRPLIIATSAFNDTVKSNFRYQKDQYFLRSSQVHDAQFGLSSSPSRFLTTQTGCRIARWFYPTGHNRKKYRDCIHQPRSKRLTQERARKVKDYDTIYCVFTKLQEFVDTLLDEITSDVIIISGQIQYVPPVANGTIDKLLNNDHVLHWFCQNIPVYGGRNPRHPKISPFPYGLKEVVHKPNPQLDAYERVFRRRFHKSTLIYAGYLAPLPKRVHVPILNTSQLEPEAYFSLMAEAAYILSPNGDRPECYRHYEALGLGTVPVTGLDPFFFRHLVSGPVIFETTDWDLTLLLGSLDPSPLVNRNLIFEEYWVDYLDSTMKRSLNWWGRD